MARPPEIVRRFREVYPSSGEPHVYRAPGRVNLIGEHTDYNLGLVLPMGIGLECRVATAARASGDVLRVHSEQLGTAEIRLSRLQPRGDWTDRVAGIAWALGRVPAQDVLISSTVPVGGGLSSSAALGVALALAFGGPRDSLELAKIARAAETDFAGVPCGIMDQFAAATGGAALLDCRSLEFRAVKIPKDLAIVAVNSMVRHELGDSAYRTRVEECAQAARELGVASLRDAGIDQLAKLDGPLLKRARHVVTENARVEAFADAASRGDLAGMGRLAVESHRSLRADYEVSCPELDDLVDIAMHLPGVVGARMTGGGFGGCTVNFVCCEQLSRFGPAVAAAYRAKWQRMPEVYVCEPAPGASQIF